MSDHERLTELFGEAIELDSTARAQLIARVRASDAALAAELVALLDADAAAPPALRTGGLLPTELDTVRDRPQRTGPPVRLSIPGYRIEGLLGEGGMGAVYAGEQESPQRRVAIKVLHVATGPALARFWTEAAIMARLDHPGIARVLESGESGGHPFIVMERVEGMTLDDHVAETRPPLHQRLELFAAVCDAVHHAHLNGVIHRDLKPSNVMVRGDGRIAVLDFGIARTATLDGSSSGETRAGELIGTPLYMSPEQARLRPDEVDARSDVYSLGVTLYELVAGDLPYPVRDLPLPALSLMICEEPPRSLRALGFERDLDAIAGKALAKDPRDRYQSAAALADDLRRYLEGRTVSVRTPGTLEQLRRFARRRPASAAAIAGGVAIALVFAIVVTRLWLAAVEAEHAAGEARARAEAARDALAARTADLTLQQARAVVARDPTRALALLDELRGSGLVGGAEISPWAIEVIATEARGRGVASHVLRGHHDEVHWVEQVPGDRGVLTASYDGTVQLWQSPFATSRTIFRAAHGRIHTARPSPDGARFAIGGDDGALHVVDPAGTHALAGHTVDVELVVWSQDGAWLVTGDDSGAVFVWPRGAAPGRRLEGPTEAIESLAFSIDGGAVIAGDDGGTVWRWDLATGARISMPGSKGGTSPGVRAVWGDRERLAAVGADGTVRRWRLVDGAAVADGVVATHVLAKRAVFTAGAASVVLAGVEGSIVRVDGETATPVGAHSAKIRGLAISRDGARIATGSEDGDIQVWEHATGRHLMLRGHGQRIRQLSFADADRVLYSADGEGVVRRWDLASIPVTYLHRHAAPLEHAAASADGRRLATCDAAGVVAIAELSTGGSRELGRNPVHVTALAIQGDALVTGDVDAEVAWWRAGGGVRRTVAGPVRAVAVSGDGARLAVATAAGPIALFGADGTPGLVLAGHAGGTEAVAFDPSGELIASGGQDREVRVWRVATGEPVAVLSGPTGDTQLIELSPDGGWLIAGGDDGKLRAWAVGAGGAIAPGSLRILGEHAGSVTAIAFDRGGRYVASAGRDAAITRAELATGVVLRTEAHHRGATGISVDDRGVVLVAAEGGDLERWAPPGDPISVPITTGTTGATALPDGTLAVGGQDGALRLIAPR